MSTFRRNVLPPSSRLKTQPNIGEGRKEGPVYPTGLMIEVRDISLFFLVFGPVLVPSEPSHFWVASVFVRPPPPKHLHSVVSGSSAEKCHS
jgi:hypothetical protein